MPRCAGEGGVVYAVFGVWPGTALLASVCFVEGCAFFLRQVDSIVLVGAQSPLTPLRQAIEYLNLRQGV